MCGEKIVSKNHVQRDCRVVKRYQVGDNDRINLIFAIGDCIDSKDWI